jgi:hypothetical protein
LDCKDGINIHISGTGVTKYFEPGWKLTRGSFFNVEYWDRRCCI